MSISFDPAINITTAANNDFSAAIICPDPKTGAVLFLCVGYNAAAATLNAATIGANSPSGGISLEQLAQPISNPDMRVFMCRKPPNGSQTIFLDWTSPPASNQIGYAVFVYGINPDNVIVKSATANSASATIAAPTSDFQYVLDFVISGVGTTPSVTGGQTLLAAQGTDMGSGTSFKTGSANSTTTMSYTVANAIWGICSLTLTPALFAGAPTLG